MGRLRGLGAGIINQKKFNEGQFIKISDNKLYLSIYTDSLKTSLKQAYDANSQLKGKLGASSDQVERDIRILSKQTTQLLNNNFKATSSTDFFNSGSTVINGLFQLYDLTSPLLYELLQKRIDKDNTAKYQLIVITLISILLAVLFIAYVTRDILKALKQTQAEFAHIAEGDYKQPIEIDRKDELGDLMRALKSLQIKAGFDVNDANERGNAMARIKVALDNVSSNVMLADNDRNIIYTNKAVIKLLSNAEKSIQSVLPNFNVSTLNQASIDSFHKNPSHQKQLLENLTTSYTAEIDIADKIFSLTVNPVNDEQGTRLGTVVEWVDRTLEISVEKEVENIIQAAKDGDLTQQISVEGKSNFFLLLANGINELISVVDDSFQDVSSIMTTLSDGDLTQKVSKEYKGTYDEIKNNINNTIDKLNEVVESILVSSNDISQASSEISQGNTDLSVRASEQAATLEETAASMEELTSTVRHNSENARQANQLSDEAKDMASEGRNVVDNAIEAMNEISTSSNKISEIISVIDEIAFQTNLLALNASVEAARAGEQGRGFAVVATEVRSLAQRSAGAAKEIKELINDSVEKVKNGGELVDQSGEVLKNIATSVQKVSDIISEISGASEQQTDGIEEVNKAVAQLDEITQKNAALAEETAAASNAASESATDMENVMTFFKTND